MSADEIADLLRVQEGVISRCQVLACEGSDDLVAKRLRRRDWALVHRGVYVNHTGHLTLAQRKWAAVLFYAPAALCHRSACDGSEPPDAVIHVAIEYPRKGVRLSGVQVHRIVGLDSRVMWNTGPPRVRVEHAVLDVCADARSRTDALAEITDVCQRRRTTPGRIRATLKTRRLRFGAFLRAVIGDVEAGAMSALEAVYLRRVERRHGLPKGDRQHLDRTEDGVVYRDVRYKELRLLVELDGRVGHEWAKDRWDDMDRDLLAATGGELSIRLGWRHADDRACTTAARLARLMQLRGWQGTPRACSSDCPVGDVDPASGGTFQATGAGELPAGLDGCSSDA